MLYDVSTWRNAPLPAGWGAYGERLGTDPAALGGATSPAGVRADGPRIAVTQRGRMFILDVVNGEQGHDAGRLAAAAEEVAAGHGPVAVARPGHQPVVLVSAEEWQRLQQLESADSTAWWRRDAAERGVSGEEPGSLRWPGPG